MKGNEKSELSDLQGGERCEGMAEAGMAEAGMGEPDRRGEKSEVLRQARVQDLGRKHTLGCWAPVFPTGEARGRSDRAGDEKGSAPRLEPRVTF